VVGTDVELLSQMYVLPLPYLSLDGGRSPVPFAAVMRRGGEPSLRYEQRDMWRRLARELALGDSDAVVETLRVGALAREAGDPGVSDEAVTLYDHIRSEIMSRLPLVDSDGQSRTGSDDVPQLMDLDDAWAGHPKVGTTLRG
jgi:hypothetical protein